MHLLTLSDSDIVLLTSSSLVLMRSECVAVESLNEGPLHICLWALLEDEIYCQHSSPQRSQVFFHVSKSQKGAFLSFII